MAFSLEEDYLLGALVVLLIVAIVWFLRRDRKNKGSFANKVADHYTVIPPPATGWDAARGGGDIYGGTVPGWGEDYVRPPF